MKWLSGVVSVVALAVLCACVAWLIALENALPAKTELVLDGGAPATLYLPDESSGGDLPPAVVLVHGFASDRAGVSGLARALIQAGYAVLTPDLRGHGGNRNPFYSARGRSDFLLSDIASAVDFLRISSSVDSSRISLAGHSMGAGAVLSYATRDNAVDAAVMISGGWQIDGPFRPPNALFIYAEHDPSRIRERSAALASELAAKLDSTGQANAGSVHGSFARGDAVSFVEVARADHITILTSEYAARRIIGWLDDVYGTERGTFFLRADPRLPAAGIGLLAFVLLLPGLGGWIARLGPRLAERPTAGALPGLGALVVALALTLPLAALGGAANLIPLVVADVVVSHWFAVGVALLAWLVMSGHLSLSSLITDWPATVGASGFGLVAIFFLLSPLGVGLHALGLTPERLAAALLLFACVLPFELAFHFLLRRGGLAAATFFSLLGRAALLATLLAAVSLGVLSGVVLLMLPVFAGLFAVCEILAAAIYARSRNFLTPALIESGWLAWILAAVLPITW